MDRIDGLSLNLEKNNIDRIKDLFPEAVEEGKINFDMLRAMLGDEIDDSREKYQFTCNGKAKSIKLAQTPSSATLRPCKDKSKNWDTTENLYIEGDNLEVLKQLQKTYYGKIKMIYIDPPYNTGNDFIYHDKFSDSIENYKEQTNQVSSSNPESNGRYHSNWLSMMYSRLILSKSLLTDDGCIFISIDDNEIENLKKILNEIYGENNFVAIINWKGRGGKQDSKYFACIHEYILCYAKNKEFFVAGEEIKSGDIYPKYDEDKKRFYKTQLLRKWGSNSLREDRPNLYYPITAPDGSKVYPIIKEKDKNDMGKVVEIDGRWRQGKETMKKNMENDMIEFVQQEDSSWIPYEKIYAPLEGEEKTKKYTTWIDETNDGAKEIKKLFGKCVFDYPKNTTLIQKFIKMANVETDDYVLDFFSGSATTAHTVMKLNAEDKGNRKFIMVQLPELCNEKSEAYKAGYKNICEIGEERIHRAGEQIKAEWEKEHPSDGLFGSEEQFTTDIGFKVFKLDSTNVNEWDPNMKLDEKELAMRLGEVFKEDRSKEDILYEIMLKYGVFDKQVEEIDVNGKTMYRVGKRYMIVCLEDCITSEDVKAIAELSPRTVIFNEAGFTDDNSKINAVYNLEKAGVEDVKCI